MLASQSMASSVTVRGRSDAVEATGRGRGSGRGRGGGGAGGSGAAAGGRVAERTGGTGTSAGTRDGGAAGAGGAAGTGASATGAPASISSGLIMSVPGISSGSTFRTTSPSRITSPSRSAARSTFLSLTNTPFALPASRTTIPWGPASSTAWRREHFESLRTRSQEGSRPRTATVP